ncbi:MAG: hypothetical protein AAGI46_15510 [Planctomycetota bacterium]
MTAKTNLPLFLATVALACVLGGCGPRIPQDALQVPKDLQPKGLAGGAGSSLTPSLTAADSAAMSDDKIRSLVDEQLELPEAARVSVFAIGQTLRRVSLDGSPFVDANDLERQFFDTLTASDRIGQADKLPKMLFPAEPTLTQLREAAALHRADLMLVLQTLTRTTQVVNTGELTGATEVEAVLIDVRTGTIAWSTETSAPFAYQGNPATRDGRATVAELNRAAASQAWNEVASGVAAFVENVATISATDGA